MISLLEGEIDLFISYFRSRDTSDETAMGYGLESRGSIPGKGMRFFSSV
jgi:hypothetical protein